MTKPNTKKYAPHPFHLLIPAAGNATRMGDQLAPKPYLKVMGQPILRHTIKKFLSFEGLKSLCVIIQSGHEELYHDAVHRLVLPPPIIGSNTRKLSIYNGLKSLSYLNSNETILIHDAARPMVQPADIQKLLQTMQEGAKAATLATAVSDTLSRENGDIIERNGLWAIQTPQAFKFDPLMEAHTKFADDENFTDDTGLMHAMGHDVVYVPASPLNIKITTLTDFDMVKTIMENSAPQFETRTASGFDVHAFEAPLSEHELAAEGVHTPHESQIPEHSDAEIMLHAFEAKSHKRPLMLGGVQIPHHRALTGHSDADVVLHAITDAVLGTINAGDIGTHFPPSDPQWKDANSDQFLTYALKLLTARSGTLTFIDVTIMAEEPKIGPHRTKMQARIAGILDLPPERISIKATTTEKLGFTGRKEGIACQALATITLSIG